MHINYVHFLNGQCAHCSQPLEDIDGKMTTIAMKTPKYDVENFCGIPFSSSEQEITNFDAICVIYGISHYELAEKLAGHFKDPNREHNHKVVLESEANENAKMCSSIAISRNLTFCPQCSLHFTEIFQTIEKFRNRSDKNSLLSKTLHEQFCKIDEAHRNNQDGEREIKMEYNSTDFEDDPSEDLLLIDKDSLGSLESSLENMKKEHGSENDNPDVDNDTEIFEPGPMSTSGEGFGVLMKTKHNLKTAVILLERLPEKMTTMTIRPQRRSSLKRKAALINEIEDVSDDDWHPSDDEKPSTHPFRLSQQKYHPIKKLKCVKTNNSEDDCNEAKVIHTKTPQSSDNKAYISVPIKTKVNAPQKYNYICKECGIRFATIKSMRFHLLSHNKVKLHPEIITGPPFHCPKCNKILSSHENLDVHCVRFHNLKLQNNWATNKNVMQKMGHRCLKCGLAFERIRGLCRHSRFNHKTKMYMCAKCDKGFLMEAEWLSHKQHFHSGRENLESESAKGVQIVQNEKNCEETSKCVKTNNENDICNEVKVIHTKTPQSCDLKAYISVPIKTKLNAPQKYNYICKECGIRIGTIKTMRFHLLSHNKTSIEVYPEIILGPPYHCPKCNKGLSSYESLDVHCVRFHNLRLQNKSTINKCGKQKLCHKCPECGLTFERIKGLCLHYKRKHKTKMYMCRVCDKGFIQKSEWLSHEHDHPLDSKMLESEEVSDEQNEREICKDPFFCRECGFSFKTPTSIICHNQHSSHHPIKQFDCKRCDESFKEAAFLLRHLSSFHKIYARPEFYKDIYWCTDCENEALFVSFQSLKIHFEESNHSSFKMTCAICEKSFQDRKVLKMHKKLKHPQKVRLKNYSCICPFCDEKFSSPRDRIKHQSTHPKEEQLYKCRKCPKIYTKINSLSFHTETIHSEKFQCTQCEKTIGGRNKFRQHLKIHEERKSGIKPLCDLCGKTFISKAQLHKHKFQTHLRKEEKTCEICGYVSRTTSYFKLHMKVHERNGIVKKRKKKEI